MYAELPWSRELPRTVYPVIDDAALLQSRLHSLLVREHLENAERQGLRISSEQVAFTADSTPGGKVEERQRTGRERRSGRRGLESVQKLKVAERGRRRGCSLTFSQESCRPDSPAASAWCICSHRQSKIIINLFKEKKMCAHTHTPYALRRKVFRDAFWESMFVARVNSSSVQIWKNTQSTPGAA